MFYGLLWALDSSVYPLRCILQRRPAELTPINRSSDSFGRNPASSIARRRSHMSPTSNPPGFKKTKKQKTASAYFPHNLFLPVCRQARRLKMIWRVKKWPHMRARLQPEADSPLDYWWVAVYPTHGVFKNPKPNSKNFLFLIFLEARG